jgi:uncharacterized membrane protein
VYFGNMSMSGYLFLKLGLVWVLGVSLLGFSGAFVVGWRRGGRAAERYTKVTLAVFLTVLLLIAIYALLSTELTRFLGTFGPAPLLEMLIMAFGCVFIMWFMATQYSRSRIAIDERFGSKEALTAAKETAKRAQQEAFCQALSAAQQQHAQATDENPDEGQAAPHA